MNATTHNQHNGPRQATIERYGNSGPPGADRNVMHRRGFGRIARAYPLALIQDTYMSYEIFGGCCWMKREERLNIVFDWVTRESWHLI